MLFNLGKVVRLPLVKGVEVLAEEDCPSQGEAERSCYEEKKQKDDNRMFHHFVMDKWGKIGPLVRFVFFAAKGVIFSAGSLPATGQRPFRWTPGPRCIRNNDRPLRSSGKRGRHDRSP